MFFAGLEDVEHKPHSVYIDRYPEGREATVAWPSVDLRFKNTTPYGVLIKAHVAQVDARRSQGAATVSMYSTKRWKITSTDRSAHELRGHRSVRYLQDADCEEFTGTPGFSVDVFRTFRPARFWQGATAGRSSTPTTSPPTRCAAGRRRSRLRNQAEAQSRGTKRTRE